MTSAVLSGAPTLDVLGGDITVPVADGTLVPYANLDIAATAPCAVVAATAVNDLLPWYASVHRGAGVLSGRCTQRYEQARDTIAAYLGCRPGDQVVFTRNTTDALNLLARAVPADTVVATFLGEHHANLLPWKQVVRLPLPRTPAEAVATLDTALRHQRADRRVGLVAVTGASNVTGEVWPVAELARVAHRHGARIVVDAAQLAAHGPVSLAALDVDYLAVSGHKLYAPFGAGVLAGRADWLDAAEPYLHGGGAVARADDGGGTVWATGPARHEAGTPNLLGAVALAAVCATLTPTSWATLTDREERLLDRLVDGLARLPQVCQLGLFPPGHPRIGVVGFAVAGMDSAAVAGRLAAEYGIGVRDGLFCAHPLTRHLLTARRLPPTALRASIGAGTTEEHVDRLVTALHAVCRDAPRY